MLANLTSVTNQNESIIDQFLTILLYIRTCTSLRYHILFWFLILDIGDVLYDDQQSDVIGNWKTCHSVETSTIIIEQTL